MTLRTRVTLAAGVAVQHAVPPDASALPRDLPLAHQVFRQVVDRDGKIVTMVGDRPLPVTAEVLAVARGERRDAFFDVDVAGTPVRVYVASAGEGAALQVGRSLIEVEQALRQLVLTLAVISVVTVGLATVIGRLAASFNTMLDALSESLTRQRRLVADASHELRTPLATVRTNVEVLARAEELAPEDRASLIADTVVQIGELTRLVGDLVELARGDGQEEPFTLIDLDDLTRRAVDVVGRNHPSITFRVDGVAGLIRGAPARVSRAVSNLIDNAAKWSPPGTEVEVTVHDGTVTVRDHGPGVDPADLPHVFDRFYRSPQARTMPGSGLGLAIVKQVANSHRATVTAAAAPGGGALFVLQFPTAAGDAGTNRAETS